MIATLLIDAHCHWLPGALAAELRRRTVSPCIEKNAAGAERLMIYRESLAFSERDYVDIQARLKLMDRLRIDAQLLSLPGLFGIDCLPVDDALPLVQMFNDHLAELVARYPQRFIGLAALPLADMDAACAELRRARVTLGLAGAILPADGFIDTAAADYFRPLFVLAQELGGHFFIHPGPLPSAPGDRGTDRSHKPWRDNAGQRHISLAVQARLSEVMVTLSMTDFLTPFDYISVQVANLGGTLPFLLERMDHVARIREPDAPAPSTKLRRSGIFVDCSSFGPRAIELAVTAYGSEYVLLGTDCPIFDIPRTVDSVKKARLSENEQQALLGGNARRLLEKF